ncbi:MAG: Redoxin domain-containing protein [Nitrosopumilales archaeon]|nr:MAG: Redoxin domain-containing protein [Nitrosopumilales archaeon]
MKTEIKTAIILSVIIIGSVGGLSVGFSTLESPTEKIIGTITFEQGEFNIQKTSELTLPRYKKAPDLVGISHYINTTPEKLKEEIDGKVVLYDIWTYSCINCVRTLPYITSWNEKYSDDGLLIIGIHSPEFEFEKDSDNVRMAVEKYGITYPVVLDNEHETWKAFENNYWPRKYVADHEGYIRYDHIGEGAYEKTEEVIQKLLEERAQQLGLKVAAAESLVELDEFQHSNFKTPELYFGYKFAFGRNQLGNMEGFNPEQEVKYSIPDNLQQHNFYLDGTWKNLIGSMELVSETGSIKLPYHAKEVNIVTAKEAEITILIDGMPLTSEYEGNDVTLGKIMVTEPRLYNIISSKEAGTHLLELIISNPGFEIYTFTFG